MRGRGMGFLGDCLLVKFGRGRGGMRPRCSWMLTYPRRIRRTIKDRTPYTLPHRKKARYFIQHNGPALIHKHLLQDDEPRNKALTYHGWDMFNHTQHKPHFMYLCRNLRWKSLLMVSLMNRFGVLVSPLAWFLNTTSSSHLQTTHVRARLGSPEAA